MNYYSAIKEGWTYVICRKIDGMGDHYVKLNKPDQDSYMWILDLKNLWRKYTKGIVWWKTRDRGKVKEEGSGGDEQNWSTFNEAH
jgi:hypothetical protein